LAQAEPKVSAPVRVWWHAEFAGQIAAAGRDPRIKVPAQPMLARGRPAAAWKRADREQASWGYRKTPVGRLTRRALALGGCEQRARDIRG